MLYRTLLLYRTNSGRTGNLRGLFDARDADDACTQARNGATAFVRDNLISSEAISVADEQRALGVDEWRILPSQRGSGE